MGAQPKTVCQNGHLLLAPEVVVGVDAAAAGFPAVAPDHVVALASGITRQPPYLDRRSRLPGKQNRTVTVNCELCDEPFDPLGGITTTLGYLCYPCVRWIHLANDQTSQLRDIPAIAILADIDATP